MLTFILLAVNWRRRDFNASKAARPSLLLLLLLLFFFKLSLLLLLLVCWCILARRSVFSRALVPREHALSGDNKPLVLL